MLFSLFTTDFPLRTLKPKLIALPSHKSLSYNWNFGSLLGLLLVAQLITGFLLSLGYTADRQRRFQGLISMTQESFNGFYLRVIHLNFASVFFLFIFFHMWRGMYYFSFFLKFAWLRGVYDPIMGGSWIWYYLGYSVVASVILRKALKVA